MVSQSLEDMPPSERLERAKVHISKIVNHLLDLIAVHEMNRRLVYSPHMVKHVNLTRASQAYNVLQHTTFRYELLRLAALWDGYGVRRSSIPTVISLLQGSKMLRAMERAIERWHIGQVVQDVREDRNPENQKFLEEATKNWQSAVAREDVEKGLPALKQALATAIEIRDGELLRNVRRYRDELIAHNLWPDTEIEVDGHPKVVSIKYGQESELLDATIGIVEPLYLWVNGTSFDIAKEARLRRSQDADAFWPKLKFLN